MEQRGITISLSPYAGELGTFALNVYLETYVDTALARIEGILGVIVELDPIWIHSIPKEQLAALAAEAASQLLSGGQDADTARTFRESIAREMESAKKVVLGE